MRKREAREHKRPQAAENTIFATEGTEVTEKSGARGATPPAICMDVNTKHLRKERFTNA
jgi:hypothetical protein